jgi:putative RNA 2'-phosphotransferase
MSIQASKFLSLLLRHQPDVIGLELSPEAWARVSDLIRLSQGSRLPFSRELLEQLVLDNNKQRFELSEDGEGVRARQGHSVEVDLGFAPQVTPALLFHGTAQRFLESILGSGLSKQSRLHVHLSQDPQTARKVGQRHGTPVVLRVDAQAMHADGAQFFLSTNGVWLTDAVPARFLSLA